MEPSLSPLHYCIDVREPSAHLLRVSVEVPIRVWPQAREEGAVEFFLPVWTPGSYMVREYSRHVEGVTAADAATGNALVVVKTAKNRWRVRVAAGVAALRLEYRVYAHDLTVRTADLNEEHAFWNGACAYLWPAATPQGALRDLRARIEVLHPTAWQLACALPTESLGPGRAVLHARDLDHAMDAPVLIGTLQVHEFTAAGHEHALVLEGLGSVPVPPTLVPDVQRIIERSVELFAGELPLDRYLFLALFADSGRGGLEHSECSVLLAPRTTFAPRKAYEDFLGLLAHEYFHLWNVKRMRPQELWTFDYERENHTELLWVAEGFTSYYDDHLCLRAGVLSRDRYLEVLGDGIAELRQTPGRLVHPLANASYDAWIKYYRPDENSRNSSQSYYSSGALAALCLDLRIRERTDGARSLDDALVKLYRATYGRGRGFTHEDVVRALSETAGEDLEVFVDSLVRRPFEPDLDAAFALVGMRLQAKTENLPFLGVTFRGEDLTLASVVAGGPAAQAGLAPGDEILAVNDLRVTKANWKTVLENLAPERGLLRFLLHRRGRVLSHELRPEASTITSVQILAQPEANERQVRLRRQWLCES